jgi:hypothetical protein
MSATDRVGNDVVRRVKDHLVSWRHSADTGANARGSKVIGGRIYDRSMSSDSQLVAYRFYATRVTRSANSGVNHGVSGFLVAVWCRCFSAV